MKVFIKIASVLTFCIPMVSASAMASTQDKSGITPSIGYGMDAISYDLGSGSDHFINYGVAYTTSSGIRAMIDHVPSPSFDSDGNKDHKKLSGKIDIYSLNLGYETDDGLIWGVGAIKVSFEADKLDKKEYGPTAYIGFTSNNGFTWDLRGFTTDNLSGGSLNFGYKF